MFAQGSNSWITFSEGSRPRLILRLFIKYRLKSFIKRVMIVVLGNQALKDRALPIVRCFPGLYIRLKHIQHFAENSAGINTFFREEKTELSEEGETVYRNLKMIMKSLPLNNNRN